MLINHLHIPKSFLEILKNFIIIPSESMDKWMNVKY